MNFYFHDNSYCFAIQRYCHILDNVFKQGFDFCIISENINVSLRFHKLVQKLGGLFSHFCTFLYGIFANNFSILCVLLNSSTIQKVVVLK